MKPSPASAGRSLRAKLYEAEQALAAIRTGEVDALVIFHPAGDRVFTLDGADRGYRTLLEAMSEGVATLNNQGVINYCNARFSAILGVPLERTIGSLISSFVPEAERDHFQALIAAGTVGRSQGEFWLQAPDPGTPVPVRLAIVSLEMDGWPTQCLVMTDLTEQRKQEAETAAERARMQKRLLLAERMATLGTLAAGVAHEINNPLACVIASLDVMSARVPGFAGPEALGSAPSQWLGRQVDRARDGAERVRLIVRGLKAFSRTDDETMGVIDPKRAMDASISLVQNEICLRAHLVKDYDALPLVWANEGRLGQVFVNLLINAAQAIPPGAASQHEVRVRGHTDAEGRAVIEVHDTGTGIDRDHLPLIFNPFFSTKPHTVGTGLGLVLCKAVIDWLDGKITVQSAPGAGSVFSVVLPGAQAPSIPTAIPPSIVTPAIEPRGRLLFIDDERDLCEAMQEAIRPFYDLVTTTDARQALELLAAGQRFDLILCDLQLPNMTGIDFYSRLVTEYPAQATRAVLMSGALPRRPGDPPIASPRPLLEKPFSTEQVLSLMREAILREAEVW
ncbi:MAG: ATP-binding protein [Polyangiaceae bacterium]